MSAIEDIIYSPIQDWRHLCRDIATYILQHGETIKPMRKIYPLDRPYPIGAIELERLLELYHLGGQRKFYYVLGYLRQPPSIEELVFDGTLIFGKYENGAYPALGAFEQKRSIRDLNLVPNTYTRHYVFATDEEAHYYMNSLS